MTEAVNRGYAIRGSAWATLQVNRDFFHRKGIGTELVDYNMYVFSNAFQEVVRCGITASTEL